MNSAALRPASEPLKSTIMVHFLVGLFVPFVVYINSIIIPFVCKNKPNNDFQAVTKRVNGFTLIELVVTMAVAAILVTVAVPNMRTFIQNGRLNTQINDLIGDINLARSEAIKRRVIVGLCKSTDGVTFSAGPWGDGRVVVFDADNDNILCEADDTVLRFREPLASTNNTLATFPVVPSIIFSTNGSSNIAAGVSFTFCDDRGLSSGKQVNLNSVGQAAVITPAVGPC